MTSSFDALWNNYTIISLIFDAIEPEPLLGWLIKWRMIKQYYVMYGTDNVRLWERGNMFRKEDCG
jgi:hypothetical protein